MDSWCVSFETECNEEFWEKPSVNIPFSSLHIVFCFMVVTYSLYSLNCECLQDSYEDSGIGFEKG